MNRITTVCFLFLLSSAGQISAQDAEPPFKLRIEVDAGKYDRIDTPVSIGLDGIAMPRAPVQLFEIKDGKPVPATFQLTEEPTTSLSWVLFGTTPAGSTRIYELVEGAVETLERKTVVQTHEKDGELDVLNDGVRVLRYNFEPVPPPEGASKLYARSGFIHPLWSPAGEELTCIHPRDHIHHMGIWNPWTKTLFERRHVDFWNLKSGQGTVRFSKFLAVTKGPVFGGFRALHEHVDLKAPGGEKVALNEEWQVLVWRVGGEDAGYFLFDIVSKLTCATDRPLILLKYRYGGLGFRARSSWSKGDYLTSEGKTRKDGHGTRARWCDAYGPTPKGPAGVLFMSHPENRQHPEPMRIWPSGHIFFNFCPIQKADWKLEPGKEYVLRYRVYVHNGEPEAEVAERFWRDFGEPPEIRIERK